MREWWSKIRALFAVRQNPADLSEELDAHLELEVQESLARGMPIEEARETARRRFGNPTLVHENASEAWRFAMLDNFARDLAHACRIMRKSPGFTVAALLTLALGIGGNTMMFSVIRAVLLKPLEYRDPDRLVRLSADVPRQNQRDIGFSLERLEALKAAQSFEQIGASFIATENMTLSGRTEPLALKGARVSYNFLDVLGMAPALGRSFLPEEDRHGGPPVVMISSRLWKTRFQGAPQAIGQSATLNSVPHTIVGVLPPGFQYPLPDVDVWVPRPAEFSAIPPQAWSTTPILIGLAHLKPHVSLEQARAELDVLTRQYVASRRPHDADAIIQVALLKSQMVDGVRSMLWLLFGAVGLVLLGACASVASLLLARATARSSEFAVRVALGAGRGRLIGQLLAESLLLSLAGGVAGVLLANWGVSTITHFSALHLPRAGEIRMDGLVLEFAAALSIATGVLFGFFPALQASRSNSMEMLRAHGGGRPSSRRVALGWSTRSLLVVTQVALSIILLTGATLLMRSLIHLSSIDPGFQPAHLLTMRIALPPSRYDNPQKISAFYNELVRRVEAVPGIRGATIALTIPMGAKWAAPIQVIGQQPVPVDERAQVRLQTVTPGYFETMRIPLRRGREFIARDDIQKAPPVAIINENLARRFWPAYPRGQDPVGQHVRMGGDQSSPGLEIVGIVADVRELGLVAGPDSEIYLPSHFNLPQTAGLAVRTEGDSERFVSAIRSQVLSIDRDQPISDVKTMDEVLTGSIGRQRLTLVLLGAFAGVAVLLAMVGLFGLISYSVAQRTREVAIRRALGAQRGDILRLIAGQGIVLTLLGVAIGICGALALTRVMKGLLFGVTATDPATFTAVAGIFVVVALAASYLPARRATRLDPMTALR